MRILGEQLKRCIINQLMHCGLDRYCSEKTAECLVLADLNGITTHGTVVLPSHIRRIENGGYNLNPSFSVITETDSFAAINADNAIGFASASFCMDYAVNKANKTGIFTVFSRNANAYGAASCYALQASNAGYIGITCCNSPAAMAPIGGKDKLFGTNPLSIVIPTGDSRPIIIDMATSKVAKSKFLQAKREGKPLGEGWALDRDGKPTTDPDEGIQGLVCPMEGFKGYGLAIVIDILAGLLSGAAWQDRVGRFYNEKNEPMNVGHLFVAIDPIKVLGNNYYPLIQSYVTSIRQSQRVNQEVPIAIPGDDKHIVYEKNIKEGIEISDEVAKILCLA